MPFRRFLPLLLLSALPAVALAQHSGSHDQRPIFELSAPSPAWYTPELHALTLAAGQQGLALDVNSMRAVVPPIVQPGAKMVSPLTCTMNFFFEDVDESGDLFMGTAGHCAGLGSSVVIEPRPGVTLWLGHVAQRGPGGLGNDWGLVRVENTGVVPVPSTLLIGGPQCGTTRSIAKQRSKYIGYGQAHGGTPFPRVGSFVRGNWNSWTMTAYVSPGDSGGPVLLANGFVGCEQGQAVGIQTHGDLMDFLLVYGFEGYGTWVDVVPGRVVEVELAAR